MRDMIPRNDRSIRNIPVPTNHRRPAPRVEVDMEDEIPEMPPRPMRRKKSGRSRMLIIISIIVIGIGALLALLLSTTFVGATITVFPREEAVNPPASIVARVNAPVGSLSYQTMTIVRSATTTVPATGTKQVSRQASGLMTIYNTYSTATQRLIANTRFEAPDGKIYRIHESIVVPGMSGSNPGTISVTVYADSPGADYNRGETRFTIPGFKGEPQYAKFYAQAASVTGGFIGTEPSVAAADVQAARTTLERGLQSAVQAAALAEVPEGYIAIPSTTRITYSNVVQTAAGGNSANLSQSAQATVSMIRASDLAMIIAAQGVQGYSGEAVAFKDLSQISITAATSSTAEAPLTIQLAGSPTLVWQYDPGALVTALVGNEKGSFQTIIQSFEPAIIRAEAKIRPFWKGTFPNDPERIEIVTGNGE